MPAAAARWRVPPCDLVLSFSHCVAKAARPPEGVPHVCYCFTPMRYAWHMRESYFNSGLKARLAAPLLHWLRQWDRATADRVTHFVAISRTVQQRIAECYGRPSDVIYPPVNTDFYTPAPVPRDDYYLVVSAFAPYKRLDLALAACERLDRKLLVIGTGQDEARLRALAGMNTCFLGWRSDGEIRAHLRRCRALLFPGEEDFGIVPVEAMACGTPVIAFGAGGATESVVPLGSSAEPTGVWFPEQTVACLTDAILQLEKEYGHFAPAVARRQALRFRTARFEEEILAYLAGVVQPTTRLPLAA
jgi:glycosyltransferase involved in cell wall biosynthesis